MTFNFGKLATALPLALGAVLALANPAAAKVTEAKLQYLQNQLVKPVAMEFKFENGAWTWANPNENFKIQAKIKAKSVGNRMSGASVYMQAANLTLWQTSPGQKAWKWETTQTLLIGKAVLSPLQNQARGYCSSFGGATKKTFSMPVQSLLLIKYTTDTVVKNADMPVTVICLPKQTQQAALQVTSAKLSLSPATPICGQPIKLTAEIRTNVPGTIGFQLQRGDGESQAVQAKTRAGVGGGVVRWSKSYKYSSSITRKYRIVGLDSSPLSDWLTLQVNCGAKNENAQPGSLAN